jgi:hypothetical protein
VTPNIPHMRIVVAACLIAVAGYAVFSGWAVFYSGDSTLVGDVIGTWKSFAVAAFAFWLGSSSGGKAKSDSPAPVVVTNPPSDPVQTTDAEV